MHSYFQKQNNAAPLALFRFAFGFMLCWGIVRFWLNGWIDLLYIQPKYFFSYYGFEFVRPFGNYTYLLFAICGLSALMVALGFLYRLATIVLFLSFTYIELIDKSTYLNHYYFVSLLCLVLIFLPAHVMFSVDAYMDKKLLAQRIPSWCLDVVKLLVCLLYFYAGLAKLNSDWLLHALPLKIWLPARSDLPLIGFFFQYEWVAYFFSWVGCIYDLSIPFLLWNRRTRPFAYLAVVVFHVLTSILFPIGMFPYIMMVTALIFFSAHFNEKILLNLTTFLRLPSSFLQPKEAYRFSKTTHSMLIAFFAFFLTFQLCFPFRYLMYPGELFWTEEGYRFSWRVMLMEKAGMAEFTVRDAKGKFKIVNNDDFLSDLQEKMMATQPDMILQYAHILRDFYRQHGFESPQVYVDSYVSLNGRLGQALIDPSVDLAREKESFWHKTWILPFNDEIKGL